MRVHVGALVLGLALVGCGGDDSGAAPDREQSREQRMDRALDTALAVDPKFEAVRAVLVAVDGETVLERYLDAEPEEFHPVQSITKSVVSTLVGIAVDQGLLALDDTLAELLPSYAEVMSPRVERVTLRHLLTMTGGFAAEDSAAGFAFAEARDPVAAALRTSVGPVEEMVYSSAGAHVVAAVLAEATGRTVLDLARAELLDPLGVPTDDPFEPVIDPASIPAYVEADFAWPVDPQGLHAGWGLLKLRAVDLLAFGRLVLDRGRWEGEQLVPADWVDEATRDQVPDGFRGPAYGYEWWLGRLVGRPVAMAIGYGGQLVVVSRELDLVAVTLTELDPNDLSSRLSADNLLSTLEIVLAEWFG